MFQTKTMWLLAAIFTCCFITQGWSKQPHVFFVMIDDMGYSEWSLRNPLYRTPTLDKLATEGVLLNHMYSQPSCTMSRAAMLTGIYPHRMGIENVFDAHDNRSVPLDATLLSQRMKTAGFSTTAIGKWHLGMCRWAMTPTRRGFDSFYGCLHGNSDHFFEFPRDAFDFWSNETLDHTVSGKYDTEVLSKRAVKFIQNHKKSGSQQPMFMYLAYKAIHTPIKVPSIYSDRCAHIEDELLRDRCGTMVGVDDGIKSIIDTLERVGYLDDPSLIIVMSDNGGSSPNGATNWPLRGKKATPFEGGTRVVGFMYSRTLLPKAPYVYDGVLHVTDWVPTILKAATGDSNIQGIDGIDQWESIKQNVTSKRDRLVYELWDEEGGVRLGKYKLVFHKLSGPCSGWYNPLQGVTTSLPEEVSECQGYMLFDLEADPNETTDLSKDPQYAEQMSILLDYYNSEWTRRIPPQISALNPNMPGPGEDWTPGWCEPYLPF